MNAPAVYGRGMDRKALGAIGEEAAVRFLRRRGYRIRDRNFRCRLGELDLIAEHRGTIVFVEVKTRTTAEFGAPFEAISPFKQRRLTLLATYYLVRRGLLDRPCRFDAVSVVVSPDGRVQRIDVLPDAFVPEGPARSQKARRPHLY